jgi:hypothetical protein
MLLSFDSLLDLVLILDPQLLLGVSLSPRSFLLGVLLSWERLSPESISLLGACLSLEHASRNDAIEPIERLGKGLASFVR